MEAPSMKGIIGPSEILLAAAVAAISPTILLMPANDPNSSGNYLVLSFVFSTVLSIAYLHVRPTGRSPESNVSKGPNEASSHSIVIFRKYDLVLLAYGLVFLGSFLIISLPYVVWFAFLPFHSFMVLVLTVRGRNVQPLTRYLLRIGLSIVFCLGGILWPFELAHHIYFT